MPRQYNDSVASVSLPTNVKKFYANTLCATDHKQIEEAAWSDASKYATALASWRINGPFQDAMDLYMGNDTRGPLGKVAIGIDPKTTSSSSKTSYANKIRTPANIIGAAKIHTEFTWPDKQKIFVLCEDPSWLWSETDGSECENYEAIAYE